MKEKIKILMIEDDSELALILKEYLEEKASLEEGNPEYIVNVADDPFNGISELGLHDYDILILDLSLPGLDGLEVCQEVNAKYPHIPIIISSARNDITDKEKAFNYGASDYMPKPYNPKELALRIKNNLKKARVEVENSKKISTNKPLVCDMDKRVIYLRKQELKLTNAEFDILAYLIKRDGGTVKREELIYNCDSINEESNNKSIDVIISRIRTKIGDDSKNPTFIQAVRGIGYKLLQ